MPRRPRKKYSDDLFIALYVTRSCRVRKIDTNPSSRNRLIRKQNIAIRIILMTEIISLHLSIVNTNRSKSIVL